jgi:hypothetical protein
MQVDDIGVGEQSAKPGHPQHVPRLRVSTKGKLMPPRAALDSLRGKVAISGTRDRNVETIGYSSPGELGNATTDPRARRLSNQQDTATHGSLEGVGRRCP